MTQEEKVALLKEAGVWDVIGFPGCIDKLIALVAAHERERMKWDGIHTCSDVCDKPACVARRNAVLAEREACAKVCDEIERHKWEILTKGGKLEGLSPIDCAAAIRARGAENKSSNLRINHGEAHAG